MNTRWYRQSALVVVLAALLVGCGIESVPATAEAPGTAASRPPVASARPTRRPTQTQATPLDAPTTTVTASSRATEGTYFLVDTLVRSTQLDGIDMHVRYVERAADGLVVHVAFYNNRGEDLAYVSGANVSSAQLVGAETYDVTSNSSSLDSGIDPGDGWLNGGASVGTLTFAGAEGDQFIFKFPGFPDVPITLDQPAATPPEPPRPQPGEYQYNLEVGSSRLENIALRIDSVKVEADALLLTIAFVNKNPSDITFTSTVDGSDAVLFDGVWQQYRPGTVDQTLEQGIAPQGSIWGEGEANRGTLTFPLPERGDVVLFQFPSYPLVRLPLQAGAQASIATDADLPPSAEPRPTPTPQPTPTPLSGEDLVRQEVNDTLVALSSALEQRNREAYLAIFAPELREAQGEIFDRIGNLPIEAVKFEPIDDAGNGSFNADSSEISGYQVDLSYRVRDVDPQNVFSSTPEYTLRRDAATPGAWQITEVSGQLPFWAYGPTEATRSGAFWIFYRPEMATELPAIEREAQQAFDQVTQSLPSRAQPANVMHITATEQEFADLTERSASQFLGVATARYRVRKAGIQITSQAFFINGAAFRADPGQDRQRTIAHELTHLVLSPQTMPYTPAWISEGAAMFITSDFPRDALARGFEEQGADLIDLPELSSKTSFGEFDFTGEQTTIDYAYSAYLARYIVETYGEDKFFALYDSFADVPFETISDQLPRFGGGSLFNATFGNLAQKLTPDKVQATLGVDLATLERDFETWLPGQFQ